MSTQQPVWKCVGHIGDMDPIAHGGGFVYVDETGVYPPELTLFEPGSDEDWHKTEGATPLKAYRLCLDPPRFKTFMPNQWDRKLFEDPKQRGVVWHWYREWFARPDKLESVSQTCDIDPFTLLRMLASRKPMERAHGYEIVISYHGPFEFDQYPLEMTEDEAYERYAEEMKMSLRRA